MTSSIRPRLNPQAENALLQFYSRPDPIMINYVSRMRFLRFTFINKSSTLASHFFMRRCFIRDLDYEFEICFNNANGPCIRLSDKTLFSIMKLIRPRNFRLITTAFDSLEENENYIQSWISSIWGFLAKNLFISNGKLLRMQKLIELSQGATELIIDSSSDNLVPFIEGIASCLNYLECDPQLLESSNIQNPMKLNVFVANKNAKNVSLSKLLTHEIKCLDLHSRPFTEYKLENNCPKQEALKQLILRSNINNINGTLEFYEKLQQSSPQLNQLNLHLSTDIELSEKCQQISDEIVQIFLDLQNFSKKCEKSLRMQKLDLNFVAYLSVAQNSPYEKQWLQNLKQNEAFKSIDGLKFVDIVEIFGPTEMFSIQLDSGFTKMCFRAELRKFHVYE